MALKKLLHSPVAVIGAGKFGTAIANLLACNATEVLLYVRNKDKAQAMQQTRTQAQYPLATNITIIQDIATLTDRCTTLFLTVPSATFRSMMQQLAGFLTPDHILIHGTKGLDVDWPEPMETRPLLSRDRVKTMSEVIQAMQVTEQIGCLAGPNLAHELAQHYPTAAVIASHSATVMEQGKRLLASDRFQVDTSSDLLGVELCGTLKNIMAIGTGYLSGLGYGHNTIGLFISRGVLEMARIGQAMGTSVYPFLGLAGIGDLVATCMSSLSRNYTLGYRLAQGETRAQILASTYEATEGVTTVQVIHSLLRHYHLQAPLTEMVYQVLFEGISTHQALAHLMHAPSDLPLEKMATGYDKIVL